MSTQTHTQTETHSYDTSRRRGATVLLAAVIAAAAFALSACAGAPSAPSAAASSPNTAATAPANDLDLVDHSPGLVVPGAVHVAAGADMQQARTVVRTSQVLYTFWNTGDTSYLDQAVTSDFRDNTLPPGRPQGPTGPRVASAGFRAAVPDLTCEVPELYVTGDTFTAHLVFRGHFTGTYNGVQGHGQTIDFNAFDIQHVGAGTRINEDWHLEDNLTFLQQAGLVTVASAK
jgi:predicted ester cyclase